MRRVVVVIDVAVRAYLHALLQVVVLLAALVVIIFCIAASCPHFFHLMLQLWQYHQLRIGVLLL